MPHGPRIALLSALLAAGCHTAERQPNPLLTPKPTVNPTADPVRRPTTATPTANTGRPAAAPYSPVVSSDNFQRPIAESPVPQPRVVPPTGVPSLPSTSYPSAPPSNPIAPMNPPGQSAAAVPPTAADAGDFKIPPLMGAK